MGLFRDRKRLDRIEEGLGTLAEAIDALETFRQRTGTDLANMRADIDLQWEKVNRAIGRLAKRDAAESIDAEAGEGASADRISELILQGYNPWRTRS